jgi:osmotically-inducible protein OsmY
MNDKFNQYLRSADDWRAGESSGRNLDKYNDRHDPSRYQAGNHRIDNNSQENNGGGYNDLAENRRAPYGRDDGYVSPGADRDYEGNAGYRDNYNHLPMGERAGAGEPNAGRERERIHDLRQPQNRGKGPRNYNRSDTRIHEDIQDMLLEDPYIDGSEIEVTVDNGDVVVEGTVNDKNMKRRVEDVIENVRGVKNVEVRLRTRFPGGRIIGIRSRGQ